MKSAIPHPRIMGMVHFMVLLFLKADHSLLIQKLGVIRECGGKMHMGESESNFIYVSLSLRNSYTIMFKICNYAEEWEKAQTDFFEAFKNYDEAGSPQRITCLKYLVLANMLMESQINPFDSQETKPLVLNLLFFNFCVFIMNASV